MSVIYIVYFFSWSDGSVAFGGLSGVLFTWSDRSVGLFGLPGVKCCFSCFSYPFALLCDLFLLCSEFFQACSAGLWGLSAPLGDQ